MVSLLGTTAADTGLRAAEAKSGGLAREPLPGRL